MLTFYIYWTPISRHFVWRCFTANHTEIFLSPKEGTKHLRNIVNHIKTIGRYLHSYTIHITAEANAARKELGEPLYGCYCAVERNKERIRD